MIRLASISDILAILSIVEDARQFLKKTGSDQWQGKDGYPNETNFLQDIQNQILYVFESNNHVVGVAAISHYMDENYAKIEDGEWISNRKPYIVIHRLAVKKEYLQHGIAQQIFFFAETIAREKGCGSIRVDTHRLNTSMQKLLSKMNFQRCGTIYLNGIHDVTHHRFAYEKKIENILNGIKAIIFDMDGTMIDSMKSWYDTGEQVFKEFFADDDVDIHRDLENMSAWELAFRIFDKKHDYDKKELFTKRWNGLMFDRYFRSVHLLPGCREFLKYLRLKNIRLCIATGTNTSLAIPALKSLNIFDDFEFILTEDMVGLSKHHPAIFEQAIARLKLDKSQCLVFEDSYHSAATAKKMGLSVVGVYDEASAKNSAKLKFYAHDFCYSYFDYLAKLKADDSSTF